MNNLTGLRLGQFRIIRPIGMGGMGMVYEAAHEAIGYRVAVKLLGPQLASDPKHREYRARFLDEARAVNRVDHPGVVRVFTIGETKDHTLYIVMEFLDGQTLAGRLAEVANGKQRQLSVQQALRLVRQVAQAMMQAHAGGVVHRDLKPDNLMLVSDSEVPGGVRVKILDFGLALFLDSPERRTTAGVALGTPLYMSPEQCLGASTDGKTDVYALGAILYELLAGQPPFLGEGAQLMQKHLNEPPASLEKVSPGLPAELVQLIHRMLEKQASKRPDMKGVASEIERLAQDGNLPDLMPAATALPKRAVDVFAPTEQAVALGQLPAGIRRTGIGLRPSLAPRAGLVVIGILLGCVATAAVLRAGSPSPVPCPTCPAYSPSPAQPK